MKDSIRFDDINSDEKLEKEEKLKALSSISQICNMGSSHIIPLRYRHGGDPSAHNLFKCLGVRDQTTAT